MKKFLLEVLKRLLAGLLISIILLIASYSFFSGEFPPNLIHMKKGIFSLKEQIQNLKRLQELKIAQTVGDDSNTPDEEKNNRGRDAELKKLMQELGFNEQPNNIAQQKKQEPLTLETLEKQNIILVRKINELEYRLYMLEKKKSQAKN